MPPPSRVYYAYVAAESADRVDLVRFGPSGARVARSIRVGAYPTEMDGPHGLAVSGDGSRWYVTLAHGNPFGHLVEYATSDDRALGATELGLFPASLAVSPDGLVFAVNFDLHGDPLPSTVSVVDAQAMTEIARIETCARPHGSRITADGARHYSVCVADGQLVEIDARRLRVTRKLSVGAGCSPTWAEPSVDGRTVYVACNREAQVLAVDVERWEVTRRFDTAAGPYNLAVSPDGRFLVVTHKGDGSTGVWRLSDGVETARVENSRRLPHGIAITPDSRYAFVSVEGVGGEPGTVDVLHVETGRKVASVEVGKQAGGIAFWRMEEVE